MLRRQDWAFFVAIFAVVEAVQALFRWDPLWLVGWSLLTAFSAALARRWSRLYPGPMPYALRWIILLPHPFHSPGRLRSVLAPQPGERLLELGPGVGYHALPIAESLRPGGVLEVLDVQQAMLDDLLRRAAGRGINNIVATRGTAEELPYPDHSFDGAYLMTMLGEIPNQHAALGELRRVVRPGGRILIGELLFDPDFISLRALRTLVERLGFIFKGTTGPPFAYLALFEAP